VLTAVEKGGEAFLSNALVGGRFVLRACVVNFHTALGDIDALPALLSRLGREADGAMRGTVAGALMYSRYNLFIRFVMKRIARKQYAGFVIRISSASREHLEVSIPIPQR